MNKQPVKQKFAAKIISSTLPGAIASAACAVAAVLFIIYFLEVGEVTSASATIAIIVCAIIGAASCVVSILLPRNLARNAVRPLEMLERAVTKVNSVGDINVTDEFRKTVKEYSGDGREDEIAVVCKSFIAILDGYKMRVGILEQIARGDLSQDLESLGDQDAVGNAINNVISSISQIVREVKDATAQFAVGVREMANGAQSLSQSSAEQATTVDQLLLTVGDIAAEAVTNAEKAAEASRLTGGVRNSAGDGRKQMENMSAAMREIAEANHSIGTVMRAIDEIAFQTNILALNAAVEAARAGVHGRGFAVVADEVRNLANKSGSAAGESNAVIVDTIAKSDEGLKIVEDILAFFRKIEEGINTTSSLLDEIAYTAQKQSDSIDMINNFIANLTNAVLLNNATSEQSAAATEEMDSQAVMLEESVNRFTLKNDRLLGKVTPMVGNIIPEKISVDNRPAPAPAPASSAPAPAPAAPAPAPAPTPAPTPVPETESLSNHINPINEPAPEAGGRTPAEIYAAALGKQTSAAHSAEDHSAPRTIAPATHEEFVDDDSKY